jgi:hypothetical protein
VLGVLHRGRGFKTRPQPTLGITGVRVKNSGVFRKVTRIFGFYRGVFARSLFIKAAKEKRKKSMPSMKRPVPSGTIPLFPFSLCGFYEIKIDTHSPSPKQGGGEQSRRIGVAHWRFYREHTSACQFVSIIYVLFLN